MRKRIRFFRLAFTAIVMAALAVSVLADTVRLKDGSIIKGRITGFSGGKFTIEVGEGSRKRALTFDAVEVESIEFEPAARAAIVENVSNNTSRNTSDRYETVVRDPAGPPVTTTQRQPETRPSPVPATPEVRPIPAGSSAKPIELSVKVLADNTSNGWTNSGWVVRKGQRIRISGTGEVSLGKGVVSPPGGLWDHEDQAKLLKAVPTGALIAVIGDDNNDFIYIGNEREFVAARDGALFLGVNEGNLNDNSGAFDVRIEIFPGG